MRNGRVEAISDGVIGVAITLLVLDLHLDVQSSNDLASQLRERWPSFAAYIVSFIVIGAIWLNHYHLFQLAIGVDNFVVICNLLLLFFVTAIPFTTAAYAGYLLAGADSARLAVILYCIVMEGAVISLVLILERLLRAGLMSDSVSPQQARRLRILFLLRVAIYLLIMVVGSIKPQLMPVLYIASAGILVWPLMRTLAMNTLPEKQS